MELVHHLGDRHEVRHRAERLAAKVGVGAGENHPTTARGERRRDVYDRVIEKLRLVDRNDVCAIGSRHCAICDDESTGTASTVRPS